jgi:hypothetical protein
MSLKKIESFLDGRVITDLDISLGEPLLFFNYGTGDHAMDPLLVRFSSFRNFPWNRTEGGLSLRFNVGGEIIRANMEVKDDCGYVIGDPVPFGDLIIPNLEKVFLGPGTGRGEYEVHEVYAGKEAIVEALGNIDECVPYARWFDQKCPLESLRNGRF